MSTLSDDFLASGGKIVVSPHPADAWSRVEVFIGRQFIDEHLEAKDLLRLVNRLLAREFSRREIAPDPSPVAAVGRGHD